MDRSEAITRNIRIQVQSQYLPERSAPPRSQWFFAYRIRIANEGVETIQLLTRHWVITDATGRVEEVSGEGVVGEQPVIEPGQVFEYSSGCPLTTPFGSMHGEYQMITRRGEPFDATIPAFALEGAWDHELIRCVPFPRRHAKKIPKLRLLRLEARLGAGSAQDAPLRKCVAKLATLSYIGTIGACLTCAKSITLRNHNGF